MVKPWQLFWAVVGLIVLLALIFGMPLLTEDTKSWF